MIWHDTAASHPSFSVTMQTNGTFLLDIDIPSAHFFSLCKLSLWLIASHLRTTKRFFYAPPWNITVNISFDWITLDSREKSRFCAHIEKKAHNSRECESHSSAESRRNKLLEYVFVWGGFFYLSFLFVCYQFNKLNMTMPFFPSSVWSIFWPIEQRKQCCKTNDYKWICAQFMRSVEVCSAFNA